MSPDLDPVTPGSQLRAPRLCYFSAGVPLLQLVAISLHMLNSMYSLQNKMLQCNWFREVSVNKWELHDVLFQRGEADGLKTRASTPAYILYGPVRFDRSQLD